MKILVRRSAAFIRRLASRFQPRRLGAGFVALAALAILPLAPIRSAADTPVSIYLYSPSGPVDVTSTYSYSDGHVFDPNGNLVGTVDQYNQIEDANNQPIGFIGAEQLQQH